MYLSLLGDHEALEEIESHVERAMAYAAVLTLSTAPSIQPIVIEWMDQWLHRRMEG